MVRKSEKEQEYIALEKCLIEINLQCIFKVFFNFIFPTFMNMIFEFINKAAVMIAFRNETKK